MQSGTVNAHGSSQGSYARGVHDPERPARPSVIDSRPSAGMWPAGLPGAFAAGPCIALRARTLRIISL
jgi:hypothetical protein